MQNERMYDREYIYRRCKRGFLPTNTRIFCRSRTPGNTFFAELAAQAAQTRSAGIAYTLHVNENRAIIRSAWELGLQRLCYAWNCHTFWFLTPELYCLSISGVYLAYIYRLLTPELAC